MRASCFEHRERPLCRELEAEGGWPLLAETSRLGGKVLRGCF